MHREFTPLRRAWNTRLDSNLYHRRNVNETVNTSIKQKSNRFRVHYIIIKCESS